MAVAISTISANFFPPQPLKTVSVIIGRTLLPPPWIRWDAICVRLLSSDRIERTKFSSTRSSSALTELKGSTGAPNSEGRMGEKRDEILGFLLFSCNRKTPSCAKLRRQNGIDRDI